LVLTQCLGFVKIHSLLKRFAKWIDKIFSSCEVFKFEPEAQKNEQCHVLIQIKKILF